MRRLLSLFLTINFLLPSVWADADKSVDVIDEGEGQFRIEVPLSPVDTGRGAKESQGLEADWSFDDGGAGIGYLKIAIDTFPAEVYLDGKKLVLNGPVQEFSIIQGKHFVSLFSPKQVYLAYRDETPEVFWQKVAPEGLGTDRFGLIASYEREAVRTGTRWVRVTPEETLVVSLSPIEARRAYRRNATTAAITFFSIATVIAAAMFGSAALLAGE
ncbi:hypothetical protein HPY86_01165 [candidate division WOR-3 bacterium]|nr:hypothetical protein [candidate division WOR-3 bacterium]